LTAIQVMVKDQVSHDHGLSRAYCHLERVAGQHAIGIFHRFVGLAQNVEHACACIELVRHFIRPNGSLNNLLLNEKSFFQSDGLDFESSESASRA
jgi:hypothetical protein